MMIIDIGAQTGCFDHVYTEHTLQCYPSLERAIYDNIRDPFRKVQLITMEQITFCVISRTSWSRLRGCNKEGQKASNARSYTPCDYTFLSKTARVQLAPFQLSFIPPRTCQVTSSPLLSHKLRGQRHLQRLVHVPSHTSRSVLALPVHQLLKKKKQ